MNIHKEDNETENNTTNRQNRTELTEPEITTEILTKGQVANYFKFGFVNELEYAVPSPIVAEQWEVAVEQIKSHCERCISNINLSNAVLSFSGGLDSTLNVSYLKDQNPIIYSYILRDDPDHYYVEKVKDYWNLKRFYIIPPDPIDFENNLLKYNELWDKPRWVTDDLFTYQFYLHGKEFGDTVIVGLGTEPVLLGFPWVYSNFIQLAILKGEYDTVEAYKILLKSKYNGVESNSFFNVTNMIRNKLDKTYPVETYSDVIRDLFEYNKFSDADILGFGLSPPPIKLREETIHHALRCMFDWYHHNLTGVRYPIYEKYLNLKIDSPFFDTAFQEYALSLPIEYRFCMGSEKHVFRNAIGDKLPDFILNRPKVPFSFPLEWFMSDITKSKLIDKYLNNKNNKMFDYIDYDFVQLRLKDQTFNPHQLLMLINLSIWMTVH
jgi:asparagine synthetase B (glutamine-hydrolysing)